MLKDKKTTIAELKKIYKKFLDERNWMQYQDPKSIAVSISLEASELLELFQWDDRRAGAKKLNNSEYRNKIRYELADVLTYIISFAIQADIDLAEVFEEKLEKTKLKFPAEIVKKDRKAYQRIKAEYRSKGKN